LHQNKSSFVGQAFRPADCPANGGTEASPYKM
jgi:hypothetical protein